MRHLVLLHGAIGSKDQLQPLADSLSGEYIVHTLNFNGHGGEPFTETAFSVPGFAGDVRKYLEQQNIELAHVFGYSMGGYVALYLAKQAPFLIDRVITLATKFDWNPDIANKEAAMLNPQTIAEKVPAFADSLQKRHHPNDWKLVLQKTKDFLFHLGEKNELLPGDYKTLITPCLLLLGDGDKMVTKQETMDAMQYLPNGKFEVLENTPHPIEKVDIPMLSHMIRNFLSE